MKLFILVLHRLGLLLTLLLTLEGLPSVPAAGQPEPEEEGPGETKAHSVPHS
jgi:hypothetical protein